MMEGIVRSVSSYNENDRLIFLYTAVGRITLIAKGAQKVTSELRTIGQYLNLISFKEVPFKQMYILMEAKLINGYQDLKTDYDTTLKVSILFDLLSFVSDNDDHEKIFILLKDALNQLSDEVVLSFGFKLLKYLGYQMNLKPDGRDVMGFNIMEARLVYKHEHLKRDLDLSLTTELLKLTYQSNDLLQKLDKATYHALKKFMYDYYEYHTDSKLTRK